MQRITTESAAIDLFGPGKHGFRDGNPDLGVLSTQLNALWFNGVQEELMSVIDPNDDSPFHQLAGAIQSGRLIAATAGGTANALTATFTPAIDRLSHGQLLVVRASTVGGNTSSNTTLKVDNFPPKACLKLNQRPLSPRDIAGQGHWLLFIYDQVIDKFLLLNPLRAGIPPTVENIVWSDVIDVADSAYDGQYATVKSFTLTAPQYAEMATIHFICPVHSRSHGLSSDWRLMLNGQQIGYMHCNMTDGDDAISQVLFNKAVAIAGGTHTLELQAMVFSTAGNLETNHGQAPSQGGHGQSEISILYQ